jgi:hypothetical protein
LPGSVTRVHVSSACGARPDKFVFVLGAAAAVRCVDGVRCGLALNSTPIEPTRAESSATTLQVTREQRPSTRLLWVAVTGSVLSATHLAHNSPRTRCRAAPRLTLRLTHPSMTITGSTSGGQGAGDSSRAPAPERKRGASPLHDIFEDQPDFFLKEILARLDSTDRAVVAQVGKPWLAAVAVAAGVDSGLPPLPRAGKSAGVPLLVGDFVGSETRLAWAKANGCPWTAATSRRVARGGRLEVMVWAWAHNIPCGRRTCVAAASKGHLGVLTWLRQRGCPWSERTCAVAAAGGHLEVLIWARQHGCEWNSDVSAVAAQDGHWEVLRWAWEHGCEWHKRTCAVAALHGHLEVLQWAREHGCEWDSETCAVAAGAGHLAVLRWARENGCPWKENLDHYPDLDCCALAAGGGHLEVLTWLREHECPWSEGTCAAAAFNGRMEVLRWLRENECPWDGRTCSFAAWGGHLEVLMWAGEHGCPISDGLQNQEMDCCALAASGGHLGVLRWLREHDCPWNGETCGLAARHGQLEALKWVLEHGRGLHSSTSQLNLSRSSHSKHPLYASTPPPSPP